MIPASLKTGSRATEVMPSEQERELQEKITSIMMVLMKRSLVAAATYVLHNGGTTVEAIHISKGVKLEATTFFDSDDLEEETMTMQERIFGQESDDDSNIGSMGSCSGEDNDSGGNVVYSDDDNPDPEKKKMLDTFIGNVEDDLGSTGGPSMETRTGGDVCECDICSKMDAIDQVWESWDVSDDPVKFFLKQHVNNTDTLIREKFIDV